MRIRILGLSVAALVAVSCGVHQADVPNPSGPSTLAKSVTITVSPDTLSQNGIDTAAIQVSAFGPDGRLMTSCPDQPQGTCSVHLDMLVGNQLDDYGTLSTRTLFLSGGTGKASFTAPQPLPPGASFSVDAVTIRATLAGTDAQSASNAVASVHLTPPGIIVPPGNLPVPQFTFSPATPAANAAVIFDASASCAVQLDALGKCQAPITDIISFNWNFGDGGSSSGVSAAHSFAGGTYAVRLTVTNKFGASLSTTKAVTVGSGSLPTPKFVFSPTPAVVAQPVQFNASQSVASPGHTIVQYAWDFGDGSSGSGQSVAHTYAVAAQYNVTLTVTDDAGQQASTNNVVPVGTGAPIATFSASALAAPPHSMNFDATASQPVGGATITSYAWTFGDGQFASPSGTPSTQHTYAAAGSYSVTLTVTDNFGRSSIFSQTVSVP